MLVLKKLVQTADDIDAPGSWLRREAKRVAQEKPDWQNKGWQSDKDKNWENKKEWEGGEKQWKDEKKWEKKWEEKSWDEGKWGGQKRQSDDQTWRSDKKWKSADKW